MWCCRHVDRCLSLVCDIIDLPISTSTYRCSHLSKNGGSKVVHLITGKEKFYYLSLFVKLYTTRLFIQNSFLFGYTQFSLFEKCNFNVGTFQRGIIAYAFDPLFQ